jgi:hypothetical protein
MTELQRQISETGDGLQQSAVHQPVDRRADAQPSYGPGPPFSNVPGAYRVESAGRPWDVNCAWDSLALARLLDLHVARLSDQGGPGRERRAAAASLGGTR